jgi:hypothetical protein
MNWFLYEVTEDFLDENGEVTRAGESGVGECSMQPGIMEAPYGTMYVVSGKDIKTYFKKYGIKHINAHNIKKAIIHYYFKKQEEPKNDDEFIFD